MTMPNYNHCMAVDCPVEFDSEHMLYMWPKWATPEQVELFHSTGDLPLTETTATIYVVACEDHLLPNPDHMIGSLTHDATCSAPPVCNCSVSGGA
jgi:hypothetical protein